MVVQCFQPDEVTLGILSQASMKRFPKVAKVLDWVIKYDFDFEYGYDDEQESDQGIKPQKLNYQLKSGASIEMTKGGDEQNVPMESRVRSRKNSRSRDMLSALEGRVINLEESMGGVKGTLEVVEGCTDKLNSMREQHKDFVTDY
ncbi:hypothetical protein Gotri_005358 [Gossypium trilobum]|uniref:Uncharacterized protein n=1 Tax=Gossypium trilobum TaxID=34281 RepID=A0A7J9EW98_9ROSI|nr:hypothetical protein [Gossypium trilobum]